MTTPNQNDTSVSGPALTRRRFLSASAAVIGVGAVGWATYETHGSLRGTLLSAFENARGEQFIGGLNLATMRVFGARIAMRAHGCAVDPLDPMRVIFFARRPGFHAFELDRKTNGARTAFTTPAGRHLAGHGLFSRDGSWLYTPEHDFDHPRGVIAVRNSRTFAIEHEIDTHGIDPHEIALSSDHARLIVANGGILTHPKTYRRKLNIPTMDPSLCVLNATDGACLEQWRLPDHLLSIRHLAAARDGSIAVGLQYEGAPEKAPTVAALYRPNVGLVALPVPDGERSRLHGYVASVALSEAENAIIAACPYGNGVAVWSLRERAYERFLPAAETYGVSRLADGSFIASQRDGTAFSLARAHSRARFVTVDRESPIRWDDHWVSVA